MSISVCNGPKWLTSVHHPNYFFLFVLFCCWERKYFCLFLNFMLLLSLCIYWHLMLRIFVATHVNTNETRTTFLKFRVDNKYFSSRGCQNKDVLRKGQHSTRYWKCCSKKMLFAISILERFKARGECEGVLKCLLVLQKKKKSLRCQNADDIPTISVIITFVSFAPAARVVTLVHPLASHVLV